MSDDWMATVEMLFSINMQYINMKEYFHIRILSQIFDFFIAIRKIVLILSSAYWTQLIIRLCLAPMHDNGEKSIIIVRYHHVETHRDIF